MSERRDASDAPGAVAKVEEFIILLQRAPNNTNARTEVAEQRETMRQIAEGFGIPFAELDKPLRDQEWDQAASACAERGSVAWRRRGTHRPRAW